MAEVKNPISERVKKMAAILAAAKEVSLSIEKEKARRAEAEKASPSRPVVPPPS